MSKKSVGAKSFLIGAILVLITCYWIVQSEVVRGEGYLTELSLFANVVFSLFVLTVFSLLLKYAYTRGAIASQAFRAASLNRSELLIIYVMLATGTALVGHDMMQPLVPIMGHAFWFATPENEWETLFWKYIPRWLTVENKEVLREYYLGDSTLYTVEHLRTWLKPVLAWASFLFVLVFVMLCINVIFRKQWAEREKLSYPIIQLPLAITDSSGGFFRNSTMWVGFGVAGAMDLMSGLHHIYPLIPELRLRIHDISPLFPDEPFNAIGWMPVAVYPFAVGLSFFLPVDLSFSVWFFYLFWKVIRIGGRVMGWRSLPRFPYETEQTFGAWIGLLFIAIWMARSHLSQVIRTAFDWRRKDDAQDTYEPMRYRTALLGLVFGILFITIFCYKAGMSFFVPIIFFSIYLGMSTTLTRIRAELGPPGHDLTYAHPEIIMIGAVGTRRLGPSNLTMFSFFRFLTRVYGTHPMPVQLEGFKIAERVKLSNRKVLIALGLASFLGIFGSFWALLHNFYQYGAANRVTGFSLGHGAGAFNILQNRLNNPIDHDYPSLVFISVGLLFTFLLMALRINFFWWTLHPGGFALAGCWAMNYFWFSFFISWLVKWLILRHGGLKMYQRAVPFFLGMILGQFSVSTLWNVIVALLGLPPGLYSHATYP